VLGAFWVVGCDKHALAEIHQTCPVAATGEGDVSVHCAARRRDGFVMSGHHPSRRALEDREAGDLAGDFRYYLCCCRSCADDAHSLAANIIVPVPARRMHNLAFKFVQAWYFGILGGVQLANSGDEKG